MIRVKDEFQSIEDLIRNYDELDAAIIATVMPQPSCKDEIW